MTNGQISAARRIRVDRVTELFRDADRLNASASVASVVAQTEDEKETAMAAHLEADNRLREARAALLELNENLERDVNTQH